MLALVAKTSAASKLARTESGWLSPASSKPDTSANTTQRLTCKLKVHVVLSFEVLDHFVDCSQIRIGQP